MPVYPGARMSMIFTMIYKQKVHVHDLHAMIYKQKVHVHDLHVHDLHDKQKVHVHDLHMI
jgi:hypothetical protein